MALLIKLFYDLEWKYYCLLPKTVMPMKHLPTVKFFLSLSAQIKDGATLGFCENTFCRNLKTSKVKYIKSKHF